MQKHILFSAIVLLLSLGCQKSEDSKTVEKMACPLANPQHSVEFTVTSTLPLPPNLAFALNGSSALVEECSGPVFPQGVVSVHAARDGFELKFVVSGDINMESHNIYFPGHSGSIPSVSTADIKIYSKGSCSDPVYSEVADLQDVNITWSGAAGNSGCPRSYRAEGSFGL